MNEGSFRLLIASPLEAEHVERMRAEAPAGVEIAYEPEGLTEQLGAKAGLDSRQVKGDLKRFKELIESRGVESGAYRDEVHAGQERR